jgi:hypothetical protein
LGWSIHRIWSTDWWHDSIGQTNRLHQLLTNLASTDVGESPQVVEEPGDEGDVAPGDDANDSRESVAEYADVMRPEATLAVYTPSTLEDWSRSDFYAPNNTLTIRTHLLLSIEAEGPIAETELFQRLARAWGLNRTGHKIVKRLRDALPRKLAVTSEENARFFWPQGIVPDTWTGFRVSNERESSQRHVTEVCRQELANIALHVLESHGSMCDEELARTVARLVGMARVPEGCVKHLHQVFRWMQQSGRIQSVDGRLRRRR